METIYFECLESTQKYLVNAIKSEKLKPNIAIIAKKQTAGVGSRENSWESDTGDLALSFAIKKDDLPSDLPVSSASIYFAFLMKELLSSFGQECWLKWPNDIYIKNKKAGGVITQLIKGVYVVGIGINLTKKGEEYASFKLDKSVNEVSTSYFILLKKRIKWQEIFSKFKIEYEKINGIVTTINGKKIKLTNATLCEDGALLIENERIYSLR